MVGRLDGPTPVIVKRLVDDAMDAEQNGLSGTFYIDARGLPEGPGADAYALYDVRLRNLYKIIRSRTSIPVVLDDKPEVFAVGSCPRPPSIAARPYPWASMWMPSPGRKARWASMWPAPNAARCTLMAAPSGANDCWRKVWPPPWGRWPNPIFTLSLPPMNFSPVFSAASSLCWKSISALFPISRGARSSSAIPYTIPSGTDPPSRSPKNEVFQKLVCCILKRTIIFKIIFFW